MARKIFLEHVALGATPEEDLHVGVVKFNSSAAKDEKSSFVSQDEIVSIQYNKEATIVGEGTITPDAGYDCIGSANVTVHSETIIRSADDVVINNGYVDMPLGLYQVEVRKPYFTASYDAVISTDNTDLKIVAATAGGKYNGGHVEFEKPISELGIEQHGVYNAGWTKRDNVTVAADYTGWIICNFRYRRAHWDATFSPRELVVYIDNGQIAFGWVGGLEDAHSSNEWDYKFGEGVKRPCTATIEDGILKPNVELPRPDETEFWWVKLPINMDAGTLGNGDAETPITPRFDNECYVVNELIHNADAYTPADGTNIPSYQYSEEVQAQGEWNMKKLNELIKAHPKLKLAKGCYPMAPGVEVRNCKLDMNGSLFYSTTYRAHNAVVWAMGNSEVFGGELCGTYDKADNEEGYAFYEGEAYLYNSDGDGEYSIIHDMDCHNAWGFGMNTKVVSSPSIASDHSYMEQSTETDGLWTSYTNKIDMSRPTGSSSAYNAFKAAWDSGEYRYIKGYGGLGYDSILSDKPFTYRFYDADDNIIAQVEETPRMCVEIPEGTVKFSITQYHYLLSGTDKKRFNTCLMKHKSETVMYNCNIHNNASLGMCGPNCVGYYYNLEFWGQGKPRDNSTQSNRSTVGSCDIEDVQTPYIYFENCSGYNDRNGVFLMDGSYCADLYWCKGSVGCYRGWETNVYKQTCIPHHMGESTWKMLNIRGAYLPQNSPYGIYAMKTNASRIRSTDIVLDGQLGTQTWKWQHVKAINLKYTTNSYKYDTEASMALSHEFYYIEPHDGFPRLSLINNDINWRTGEKSYLIMDVPYKDGKGGVMSPAGVMYNCTMNLGIVPCGYIVGNGKFTVSGATCKLAVSSNDQKADKFAGTYDNCEISVDGTFISVGTYTKYPTNGCTTTYKDCAFTITPGSYLYGTNAQFGPDSVVKFENCTLNGVQVTSAEQMKPYFKYLDNITFEIA